MFFFLFFVLFFVNLSWRLQECCPVEEFQIDLFAVFWFVYLINIQQQPCRKTALKWRIFQPIFWGWKYKVCHAFICQVERLYSNNTNNIPSSGVCHCIHFIVVKPSTEIVIPNTVFSSPNCFRVHYTARIYLLKWDHNIKNKINEIEIWFY